MKKSKRKEAFQVDEATGDFGFGVKPTPMTTIEGSRLDGTALANMLTALAAKGLFIDNTTP